MVKDGALTSSRTIVEMCPSSEIIKKCYPSSFIAVMYENIYNITNNHIDLHQLFLEVKVRLNIL